ncbi:Hemolysin-type calcium-binding repeat-containing protein [Gemmobacter megaterium]|uniref:Hemolysin-type calcium-binding repeat-containing protein n=1 Tax=Gemmobacter megaterium TaxID=1086013 RepID=A0A1N7LNC9_9RHOB|nr:calcium-binding protein [Gemmobacter megaterium]GGE11618.1 hypothetical protein GCM10011345_16940 [Gemmobacter megaterium]SIS75241.1 Hemolysin-type calcium-binding repeat-containing protein [Gemmobacter megaterium]
MSGIGAVRGSVFHGVPEGGQLTEGADTLYGGALVQDVDALGGDDLLVLDFSESQTKAEFNMGRYSNLDWVIGDEFNSDAVARGFERLRLTGSNRSDFVEGPMGEATLNGGAGDDYFFLRGGNNVVRAGTGDDEVEGARLTDRVSGGAGFDILTLNLSESEFGVVIDREFKRAQWTGIELIGGRLTKHDDIFVEGARLDRSRHGTAEAPLNAGDGDDLLVLDYSRLPDAGAIRSSMFDISTGFTHVSINLRNLGWRSSGDLIAFERFDITATSAADDIGLYSGSGILRAGAGDDTIYVAPYADFEVLGGAGNDTIRIRNLSTVVRGGAGDDLLILALDGSDHAPVALDLRHGAHQFQWSGVEAVSGVLTGGDDSFAARDYVGDFDGNDGVDFLTLDYRGGVWRDVRFEGQVNYQTGGRQNVGILTATATESGVQHKGKLERFERFDLTGSAGADTLGAADAADTLRGMSGDDVLMGLGGADRVFGGGGHDRLNGGAGDDLLKGGRGDDRVSGSEGQDSLFGGRGQDVLGGGDGEDLLYGEAGDDWLGGGSGNDTLFGGAGDDQIFGDFGDDSMFGGAGADRFLIDIEYGFSGRDRIADFDVTQDKLVFRSWWGEKLMRISVHEEGTRVGWDGGSILLEGVAIGSLTEDNIVF